MENCQVNLTDIATYNQENQALADLIFNEYYGKFFDKNKNFNTYGYERKLELIISPRCNLGCKYCYIHRFRNQIFNEDCFNDEKTITNLKLICDWMYKNKWNPSIDIFSGELFGQEIGFKVMDTLYDYYNSVDEDMRPETISIPTNFTFICSEETTDRVRQIIKKFHEIGIYVGLSASFDGKYMEQNRPYIHSLDIPFDGVRDDAYYDRCFEFATEICSGFHPMVYSKGIELWPKNFDWFQEMYRKYDIPWDMLYLLQVRNEEWTKSQVKNFMKFIDHLYDFVAYQLDGDPEAMSDFVIQSGFNLLSQGYTITGRGMGCGIQTMPIIRLSDLMVYPCHRLGYKDFYYGQLVPDDQQVLKFQCQNVELFLNTVSVNNKSFPYCAECPINILCTGTCMGSQYESTSNMLVPIPSVCVLAHGMAVAQYKNAKRYNIWRPLLEKTNNGNRKQLLALERTIKDYV